MSSTGDARDPAQVLLVLDEIPISMLPRVLLANPVRSKRSPDNCAAPNKKSAFSI